MTTDYSAFNGESSTEKPVVRRARRGEPSALTVKVAVEKHAFLSWVFRGVLLGIGFSLTVKLIDWVMAWL